MLVDEPTTSLAATRMAGPPRYGSVARRAPALLVVVGILFVAVRARKWMASWGSSGDEATCVMQGDDLVAAPRMCATRSISIDARASAVWPWIAQIGSSGLGRAGWYS